MYIYRKEAQIILKEQAFGLIDSMRKKKEFLEELLDCDDWSFVIKVQALIEEAVTRALLTQIGDERLLKAIEIMPLVGDDVSKLALSKELNLLNSGQRRFIKKLAALRNKLAHRVDHVSFSFEKYIVDFDRDKSIDWQSSIIWFAEDCDTKKTWAEISMTMPRVAIHMSTFMLVALLDIDGTEKETKRKINDLANETNRELLVNMHKKRGD